MLGQLGRRRKITRKVRLAAEVDPACSFYRQQIIAIQPASNDVCDDWRVAKIINVLQGQSIGYAGNDIT